MEHLRKFPDRLLSQAHRVPDLLARKETVSPDGNCLLACVCESYRGYSQDGSYPFGCRLLEQAMAVLRARVVLWMRSNLGVVSVSLERDPWYQLERYDMQSVTTMVKEAILEFCRMITFPIKVRKSYHVMSVERQLAGAIRAVYKRIFPAGFRTLADTYSFMNETVWEMLKTSRVPDEFMPVYFELMATDGAAVDYFFMLCVPQVLEDIYVVKYQLTSLASFKFRGLGEDMVSDDPEAVTLAGALVIQPSEGRNLCLLVYEGDPTAVVDHYSFIPPRVLTEVMGAVFFGERV